jgi:serine protease Do
MINRFLLSMLPFSLVLSLVSSAQPAATNFDRMGQNWDWTFGSDEGGGGTSYLGVDIADVSAERLGVLKLKEEHGAEITMVDQDAPAGKAGLQEHDVIVSLNGTPIESTAQLRRMIKETPPGRIVNLGISRDGQAMTIKVQLADRHKSMTTPWPNGKMEMPAIPEIPPMPDFDVPVSVVVVHSSLRNGLMLENITEQLGEFFGVKGGRGVLVRSVDKNSRGEKAGFRAGDVVVKVNGQAIHDTSDFAHALRSASAGTAAVTVMREKREQNLTLTLPDKKDSGNLMEESFDAPEFTAEVQQAINRAGDQVARLVPEITDAVSEKVQEQASRCTELAKKQLARQLELQQKHQELRAHQQELQQRQQETRQREREMRERQRQLRHGISGELADI